eukprot:TRINITY_DN2738_c0_g1_i4.p3 TRINITY_DN2738_c0_g1~~TRINITY_DN2738_c0_g1_i4.p3  ORF type:complete len:147 (+),score=17.98 TRINITY_DN2738_c0_g1_i4:401-841(+)
MDTGADMPFQSSVQDAVTEDAWAALTPPPIKKAGGNAYPECGDKSEQSNLQFLEFLKANGNRTTSTVAWPAWERRFACARMSEHGRILALPGTVAVVNNDSDSDDDVAGGPDTAGAGDERSFPQQGSQNSPAASDAGVVDLCSDSP